MNAFWVTGDRLCQTLENSYENFYGLMTYEDFLEIIKHPNIRTEKTNTPWFIPSSYHAYDARKKEAQNKHGKYSCLVVDIDETSVSLPMMDEFFSSNFKEIRCCYHTTFRAKEEKPKWRVLFPLDKEIEPRKYVFYQKKIAEFFSSNLNVKVDYALSRVSQAILLPVHRPDSYYFYRILDGYFLDLEKSLGEYVPEIESSRKQIPFTENNNRKTVSRAFFNQNNSLHDVLMVCGYRQQDNSDNYASPYQDTGFATRIFKKNGREYWISLSTKDIDSGLGVKNKDGDKVSGDAYDIYLHFRTQEIDDKLNLEQIEKSILYLEDYKDNDWYFFLADYLTIMGSLPHPYTVYVHQGSLVTISDFQKPEIQVFPNPESFIVYSQKFIHVIAGEKSRGLTFSQRNDIYKVALAKQLSKLPELKSVRAMRYLSEENQKEGFVKEKGTFYYKKIELTEQEKNPSEKEALEAAKYLWGIIEGFYFASENDKTLTFAALLTSLLRSEMDNSPAILITSPNTAAGKSTLQYMLAELNPPYKRGRIFRSRMSGEEQVKQSLSDFGSDTETVIFDNYNGNLSFGLLAEIITGQVDNPPTARKFHSSVQVSLKIDKLIVFSGISSSLSDDLVRRFLKIRLSSNQEVLTSYKFKFDPVHKAKTEREKYLRAALVLAHYALDKGRLPSGFVSSFDEWERIVSRSIVQASHLLGFDWKSPAKLMSEEIEIEFSNDSASLVSDFLAAVYESRNGRSFYASDIVSLIDIPVTDNYKVKLAYCNVLDVEPSTLTVPSSKKIGKFLSNNCLGASFETPTGIFRLMKEQIFDKHSLSYVFKKIESSMEVQNA